MRRDGAIHTVPARAGTGWWNERDGSVLSRHRSKEAAVEAGREIARQLRAEHTIHRSDGAVAAGESGPLALPSGGDGAAGSIVQS